VIAGQSILKSRVHQAFSRTPFPRTVSASLILTLIFVCALSHGCSRGDEPAGAGQASSQEITVAAAANLTDAFTELGREFNARAGVRVTFSFGATADLSRQIENGAPFDVFASADVEHIEGLNDKGLLLPGTTRLFARGRLALWIPPGSRFTLHRVEEIVRPEIERISIAKPDVAPYGRAAVEALRALKLWTQVEPKVIYGQNVSQAKQQAATGNAEVAFIPLSLIKAGEGQTIEIDEQLHQPINQAIAVIKDSPHHDAARRFLDFVLSPQAQALLERYGYRKSDK
jgi:molybdate transport system substrate-binding protein